MLPVATELLLEDDNTDERIMARQRKRLARKRLQIQRHIDKLEKKKVSGGRRPRVLGDHLASHQNLVGD